MKRFPFSQLLAMSLLTAVAGLSFTSVFRPQDATLLIIGAVFFPALLSLIVRSWPKPNLALVLAAHLGLYLIYASMVVFPDTAAARLLPTGSTFAAIADGLRDGWATILSATVPVPAVPGALFVPVTATWLAMLLGTELLFRTRRVFPTLVPAVTLGCLGILFSTGSSGTFGWGSIVFVALAAWLIAARASSFATDPRAYDDREYELARSGSEEALTGLGGALMRHRLAMAVPFVLVVVLLAVPIARALPFVDGGRQVLLRDHYEIPIEDRRHISPLAEVAAAKGDDAVRYRMTVDQPLSNHPALRSAVLDQYDGVTWSSTGRFVTSGSRLPAADGATAAEHQTVHQKITVVDTDSPWLPTIDRPVELKVGADTSVQVNPATDALYVPGGPEPELTYEVTSDLVKISPEQLQNAGVATDESARASTGAVPELPPELAKLQADVLGQSSSPFQQLARLLAFFRNNPSVNTGDPFRLDEDATPAFTVGSLNTFLNKKGARGGRPEQFAATFATLARSAGFPARVVIGYRLPDRVEPNTVVEVRASALTAWPEVALSGLGWVALDPVPSETQSTQLTVEEQQLDAAVNSAVDQSVNQPEDRPAENPNLQPVNSSTDDDTGRRVQFALVLGVAALILLLLLLLPWFQKRRRRARRRAAADPAARAAGAWQEAMERMLEADVDEPETLTTAQAADVAAERFGADAGEVLRTMGRAVNQALHDRAVPTDELAERAWQGADQFESIVRHERSRRERLRASLDRRSLTSVGND